VNVLPPEAARGVDDVLDCLVVGGGAAGLVAAVYLGRYLRNTTVIDDGKSRLLWIAKSRNVIGFPEGIAGPELLDRMRTHAAHYEIAMEAGRVESLGLASDGTFEARAGAKHYRARTVLLATGAHDVQPEIEGLKASLASGNVRFCPVCDGFETQGQPVAVLGPQTHGLRESAFVAGFDNRVTWLSMGTHQSCSREELSKLAALKVAVHDRRPTAIRAFAGKGVEIDFDDGHTLQFDVLYAAFGMTHASQLATALGAKADDDGQLVIDEHCCTTVPNLYAIGDVAAGLNQINVAAGHAAIAATAIHNSL